MCWCCVACGVWCLYVAWRVALCGGVLCSVAVWHGVVCVGVRGCTCDRVDVNVAYMRGVVRVRLCGVCVCVCM